MQVVVRPLILFPLLNPPRLRQPLPEPTLLAMVQVPALLLLVPAVVAAAIPMCGAPEVATLLFPHWLLAPTV